MKGQLSWCRTSSTTICSQADSSWTPWCRPEERRLEEDEEEERTGLDGLGAGPGSGPVWGLEPFEAGTSWLSLELLRLPLDKGGDGFFPEDL